MTDMATNNALTALLQPWWSVFRGKMLGVSVDDFHQGKLLPFTGLRLTFDHEFDWDHCWEALELLLLASQVTPTLFVQTAPVRRTFVHRAKWEDDEPDAVVPCRLEFQVAGPMSSQSTLVFSTLKTLLTRRPSARRSCAYTSARRSLLALVVDPKRRKEYQSLVVPVQLILVDVSSRLMADMFNTLVALEQQETSRSNRLFYLDSVSLLWPKKESITTSTMDAMERLASIQGFCFGSVYLSDRSILHPNDRNVTGRLVAAVTGLNSTCYRSTSEKTQLFCDSRSPNTFSALMSAIYQSESVDFLIFDLFAQFYGAGASLERSYKMFWFLYGLFSAHASHAVTKLRLFVDEADQDEITRLREFIRSPQPLALMLSPQHELDYHLSASRDPSALEMLPSQVVIRPEASIYLSPTDPLSTVTSTKLTTKLDVMHAAGEMLDVVVPGYGQCWVNRKDVIEEVSFTSGGSRNQWRLEDHAIRELTLGMYGNDIDALIKTLLELIGRPVTHLRVLVSKRYVRMHGHILDTIWCNCPRLVTLELPNLELHALTVFVDAYEAGRCHAQSLVFPKCLVRDAESVLAFAQALENSDTAASRTLHHLDLSFEAPPIDEIVLAFLSMLKTNQHLKFFGLKVSHDQYVRFGAQFSALSGVYVKCSCDKLQDASKYAFLSVIKHARGQKDQIRALARLDMHVISLIWKMTVNPQKRTIYLKYLP